MQLSQETIEILKNFSSINDSLLFNTGSVLSTISPTKTILGVATIAEDIPEEFAIFDLSKFLAKYTLHSNSSECDVVLGTDRVTFRSDNGKRTDFIKYCSPRVIVSPPNKQLAINDADVVFDITQSDISWIRRISGISDAKHFIFSSEGGKIYLKATDLDDDSSDESTIEIGESDKDFRLAFKIENFKLMDGDYRIEAKVGLAKFTNKSKPIHYFIAVDSKYSKI